MKQHELNIVVLGLSITSSWGNGHATTYRALLRELANRGHSLAFLERDVPWYRDNRDFEEASYCKIVLYSSLEELSGAHAQLVRNADVVLLGSYVPEGVAVGEWAVSQARGLTAFYDIDTPITLASLRNGTCEYLSRALIPEYDLYCSFTGGPMLQKLEREFHSPCAKFLPCCVDPQAYCADSAIEPECDLGYLGTYSADRQPKLEELLVRAARHLPERTFAVAGPMYPNELQWPDNVRRTNHLPPAAHRAFYCSQKFTLNITRRDMVEAGHSPSVRLFEAAACGTPIISDEWVGLDSIFKIGSEVLAVHSGEQVVEILENTSEEQRLAIGERARVRVLNEHTAARRAFELEQFLFERIESRVSHHRECLQRAYGPTLNQTSSSEY